MHGVTLPSLRPELYRGLSSELRVAQPLGGFVDARGGRSLSGGMLNWFWAGFGLSLYALLNVLPFGQERTRKEEERRMAAALDRERNDPVPRTDLDKILRRQLP